MRRFFRAHRDEDFSQIQYLTAKCTRLAHDKAVVDRDFLVSRERERRLQNDQEVLTKRLLHQEQINVKLRVKHDQLIWQLRKQQDLVHMQQQRIILLAEESFRDAEVLRQVGSEVLCLQSSEVRLQGLVEEMHVESQNRAAVEESLQAELHAEAQRRAALTDSLQDELHSKTVEMEKLQETNKTLVKELEDLKSAHQKEVQDLQQENDRSLRKLQDTAEQFEWLCQQQRYWMCCVKRFKDSLMEDREALLQQVSELEKKAEKLRKRSNDKVPIQSCHCPLQDTDCSKSLMSWETDTVDDLESQVEKSNTLYEDLFNQAGSPINRYQKPP